LAFDGGGNGEDGYGLEDGDREGDDEKENKGGAEGQEGGEGYDGVMSERPVVGLHRGGRHLRNNTMIAIVVLVVLAALPTLSQIHTPE